MHATRAVHARVNDCNELQHGAVTYDMPAEKLREVHRLREEACIRSLHPPSAAAHQAMKSELRREQRLVQQTGDGNAVVRRLIDSLISRIEREAAREQRAWHCPGGCAPGSECARAAFRLQCLPTVEDLQQLLHSQWRQQQQVVEFGEFRGESGHRFVRADEQARCHLLQAEELRVLPGYRESFGDAAAIQEMKQDFLTTWSGFCEPLNHWSEDDPSHSPYFSFSLEYEYIGEHPHDSNRPPPDQFGSDHRPVGPIACARRGCSGCCYCRDRPAPAPYVQIWKRGTIIWENGSVIWRTIDELRSDIERYVSEAHWLSQRMPLQPMPTYLLERAREPRPTVCAGGAIMCIAGAVRGLVLAEELLEWSKRLEIIDLHLQVALPA